MLSRGKAGTEFIKELTRLIFLFVNKTKWEHLALSLVHIFMPLILQKPSKSSKAKDHAKYLLARLENGKQVTLLRVFSMNAGLFRRELLQAISTQLSLTQSFL